MQPRARGASLEGLVLHGLQSGLGGVDLLLGLLQGVCQLQYRMPLTPHHTRLIARDRSELAQEVAPLPVRLLLPRPYRYHTLLPVGRIVSCPVEDKVTWFRRWSIPGSRLPHGLLQVIEPLLDAQQGLSEFCNLPPLPHKGRGRLYGPCARELLQIGLTLLARCGNLLFECNYVCCIWRGSRD